MRNANLILLVTLLSASCSKQASKPSSPGESNSVASADIQLIEDSRIKNQTYAEDQFKLYPELTPNPGSVRAKNEHIQFIADVQKGKTPYSDEQLKRWRISKEPPEIPEVADFQKLEHTRLFLAANPHRYEAFVLYGLHFFRRQKFDVAVAAYDEAVAIIQNEDIKDTVEYAKFYDMSLFMLYRQRREYNKTLALETFKKLVRFDFEFFDREPELANAIYLAALDYYDIGRPRDAKRLIERARQLKAVPAEVTEQLERLYKTIEVEEAYSRNKR